jgi:integrase
MASISRIGSKWRALVRKGGHNRCQTFTTQAAAKSWSRAVESEIEELKSTGRMQPRGITVADLIDRYVREFRSIKQWGRSKQFDLDALKKSAIGKSLATNLDYKNVFDYFVEMRDGGAGGVSISSRVGYLKTVLDTASEVWRLAVPVDVVKDVRGALKKIGLVKKSQHRDRRVLDSELSQVIAHLERKVTSIPIADVLWFCMATAMRISEVCRLQWEDLNEADRTIRIRDRKHPTAKIGNHQIVPLLTLAGHDAYALVTAQSRKGKRIFPVNSKTIGTYFSDAVAEIGIEDLHLHDVRHEAISRLFEANYRIEQVAVVSGHRDWAALKRYTHLRAADLHRSSAT